MKMVQDEQFINIVIQDQGIGFNPEQVSLDGFGLRGIYERTKLYEEAQVEFKKEAPWVTIAHSVVFMPLRNNVIDYRIDPFGGHPFYGVDLAE